MNHMENAHRSLCCGECKIPAELTDKLFVHMKREHERTRSEFQYVVCEMKADGVNEMISHIESMRRKRRF